MELMKLLDIILLSLAAFFVIIGIYEVMTVGIGQAYWLIMMGDCSGAGAVGEAGTPVTGIVGKAGASATGNSPSFLVKNAFDRGSFLA